MGIETVYWGLPIVTYLFMIGITAGSYAVASLPQVFGLERYEPLTKIALPVTLAFLLLAPMGPLADAGQPGRWPELFLRAHIPVSPLGLFTLIWGLYFIVVIVETYIVYRVPNIRMAQAKEGAKGRLYRILSLGNTDVSEARLERDQSWLKILSVVGIILSIAFVGYDAYMFASLKADPLWASPMIIPMFLVSAAVSGFAIITVVYAVIGAGDGAARPDLLDGLMRLLMWMIFIDLLFDVIDMLTSIPTVYASAPLAAGWRVFLGGPLTASYWLGQIATLVLALVLTWFPAVRKSARLASLTSLVTLFSVFMMRYNIVIGGQMEPKVSQGFVTYAPPVFGPGSWQVVFGLLALAVFILSVLFTVLPWRNDSGGDESAVHPRLQAHVRSLNQ